MARDLEVFSEKTARLAIEGVRPIVPFGPGLKGKHLGRSATFGRGAFWA